MADIQRKSANLFNVIWESGSLGANGEMIADTNAIRTKSPISCEAEKTYTFVPDVGGYDSIWVNYYGTTNSRERIDTSDGTFTTPQNCEQVRFRVTKTNIGVEPVQQYNAMLNEGQTALPYEPYGWLHSLRKLTTATEAVENPLYSDGTAITNYTISGNTVQNGTPTPSNPVDVNGVGEIDNIFEGNIEQGGYSSGNPYASWQRVRSDTMILVQPNVRYYMNFTGLADQFSVVQYTTDGTYSKDIGSYLNAGNSFVFSSTWKLKFVFRNSGNANISPSDISNISLSCGYKIPISSGGVITNIYLGSTQTVRAIKKLVLTGQENWVLSSYANVFYTADYTDYLRELDTNLSLCSHYRTIGQVLGASFISDGVMSWYGRTNASRLYIGDVSFSTAAELQAYLQQQYANGTPVTVWYVLETPETGVVNEPLMKIGDYADTVSNATAIPTTEGANSITVDTTVQPSEFTATWTGWHNASVQEWNGSAWS